MHTHIPNFIDMFRIAGGFLVSAIKLKIDKPDVVFCKGGYVSLPVGIVAAKYHIPLVIHDSDIVAGLTNRVLARYANYIGTGAPIENYPYKKSITKYVGVPIDSNLSKPDNNSRATLLKDLKLRSDRRTLLITGGGLGATAINKAVDNILYELSNLGINIVWQTGGGYHVQHKRVPSNVYIMPFTNRLKDYIKVADVVVSRAGATTLAELAAVAVPTIIVPSPYLAGDHQSKNSAVYKKAGAAEVISESDLKKHPKVLFDTIKSLIDNEQGRRRMANNLHKFARPNALNDMVDMILMAAKESKHKQRKQGLLIF